MSFADLLRVIGVCLLSQSEKHNQEKTPYTYAHLVNFSTNVSAMFDNHTMLMLLCLKNEQTFRMFSLRDLHFVLRSLHLEVLRAQRIIGFLSLLPTNQRGQRMGKSEFPRVLAELTLRR